MFAIPLRRIFWPFSKLYFQLISCLRDLLSPILTPSTLPDLGGSGNEQHPSCRFGLFRGAGCTGGDSIRQRRSWGQRRETTGCCRRRWC